MQSLLHHSGFLPFETRVTSFLVALAHRGAAQRGPFFNALTMLEVCRFIFGA
ncbi:dehydrodolichyl diphosphate syntase complex subunit nus1 [Acetobacter orientalis]|uniref:Dehydrodolichyl diphosphate syntase complex subunit nus1 n=1 Tax=Acetobacter orientalis TaxID=146474 RepID=A0A2Z5ZGE4_9PROT|nr:dehydrodolichyl diphosphate syntase complex subunit nus1 [Acetobacter orientalis]